MVAIKKCRAASSFRQSNKKPRQALTRPTGANVLSIVARHEPPSHQHYTIIRQDCKRYLDAFDFSWPPMSFIGRDEAANEGIMLRHAFPLQKHCNYAQDM
jgi:hypothetical protein